VKPRSVWERLKLAVQDFSFIVGTLLVIVLITMAAIGPEIAPRNPFVRDMVQWVNGELVKAPIPPNNVYPLGTDSMGRDLLSLLLYGARQTIIMAVVATVIRILVGLLLGMIAGWKPGSPGDRLITAVTEFLAAIPGLILGMLLIFAIGIDRGQVAFVVALSIVGIGDITQTIRGHVLGLRSEGFIEAARAVGLSSAEILSRHVLPNLLPTLLALFSLQMGSALLLLGELGFIGVWIGGGGRYTDIGVPPTLFFTVPDWGAMLGTSWASFRAHPWLPLVPAVAFLVSILSFNLFGHGLQRFFERGRFYPSGWSVARVVLIIAGVLVGLNLLLSQSGLEAHYVNLAEQFNVERAWQDIVFLTQPETEGRVGGTQGAAIAAGYIAKQYEAAGLTPNVFGSYFQPYDSWVAHVNRPPELFVLDSDGQRVLDLTNSISFDPRETFGAQTDKTDRLVVVANFDGHLDPGGYVLLLDPHEDIQLGYFGTLRHSGVLRVVPDAELASREAAPVLKLAIPTVRGTPLLLIGESAARVLLTRAGLDLDELRARDVRGEAIEISTDLQIHMSVDVSYESYTAYNVVGYRPATDMSGTGTQRVLVIAPYTTTAAYGSDPYPGADENASGVAVMLELARLLDEVGYQPSQTIVFAALDQAGGPELLLRPIIPTDSSDSWTVLIIEGVGAGEPRLSRIDTGGGFAGLFDQSARRFHLRTAGMEDWLFFFSNGSGHNTFIPPDTQYTGLAVTRLGSAQSGTQADTRQNLEPRLLSEAGRALAHFLMVLSSS